MFFRTHFALIVICLLSSRVMAEQPQRVLVKEGQSLATIIVQPNEPKSQRAAEVLQKYLEKITGAKILIEAETEKTAEVAAGQTRLLVGDTQRAKKLKVAIPRGYNSAIRAELFNEEGFLIKTVGNEIVIGGNNDGPYKGTIFAAYQFLEKLGCRWYFPGEWGEILPQAKTLAVEDLDISSSPDFPVRMIGMFGWVPVTKEEQQIYLDWCEKISFNSETFYPLVGDGFLGQLLPKNENFEKHPEYYAMGNDGQRNAGAHDRLAMLCLSNPEVFRQSVENLRAAFAGERKLACVSGNGFGISPPDGAPLCQCKECKSISQNFLYPNYVHEPMTSEEFFSFATRLAKLFPDKICATMAYALREMPPQGIELPPNMSVLYAPISCDVLHANDSKLWRRAEYVKILKEWRARTPHVVLYEYNPGLLTGMFIPERGAANMAINAPIYKKMGIKGMVNQGSKSFMQTWLSYYLTAKLLWNAELDAEAVKHEFYTSFFGPKAGPSVQAWWDACEAQLGNSAIQVHEDFLINHLYSVAFVNSIRPHLDTALAAEATPQQKERIKVVALIADHLAAWATMTDAERRLDWAEAAASASKMVELQHQLHDAYPFLIDNHPKLVRPYFAEGRKAAFEKHLAKTNGDKGTKVAELPLEMKFRRDSFNEGILGQWYQVDHDDSTWEMRDTYLTWDQQEPPLDEAGHDYDGHGWYRGTVEFPADAAGKPVRFYCGGAINEAWVWINGKYAGHKKHDLWWSHVNDFELDVTDLIVPGKPNQISVRVWNSAEIGGLFRRGFFWSPSVETAAKDRLYGQRIVRPAKIGAPLTAAIDDAIATLGKVTGRPFQATDQSREASITLKVEPADGKKPGVTLETFSIRSTSADQLLITSSSEQGLQHGLYYYLDQLGCRWYFPGDNWTILPSRQDIVLSLDRTITPTFRARNFFGTGGFGKPNPVDPKLEVSTRWDRWKSRNHFGGEFTFSGHTGEAFNMRFRKTLEEHPEYFALIDGVRQPWAQGTKHCISNPELRKLYIQDRLDELKRDPSRFAVSVEPADGSGNCQCDQCAKIGSGSVSDRTFFLANEVAKAVKQVSPSHWVSLCAYGEHADLPTIALEPNVYVLTVPYGFQRTNMTGDQLLNAWSQIRPRLGMYDYWSIPDWARDQPDFNWKSTTAERIRYWHSQHVESVLFETSSSAGSIGLGLYLGGKLLWDIQTDTQPIVDEFFQTCFGPAEPPMRRMLERWSTGFLMTDHELGLSFRDIEEAKRLAGANVAIAARVEDYAKYVHFLRLLNELQGGTTPEAVESQRRLMTWMWRVNDSCMVHSYRMAMLVARRWSQNPSLYAEFAPEDKNAPAWKNIQPVSSDELTSLIAEGISRYKPADFEGRTFSSDLVTLSKRNPRALEFSKPLRTWGQLSFDVEAAAGLKTLPLKIQIRKHSPGVADPLTVRNAEGNPVYQELVPADGEIHEVNIPIPSAGRYKLEIVDQKRFVSIQFPLNIPIVMGSFVSTDLSPPLYFYIPKGTTKIVMHLQNNQVAKFRDSKGTLVPTESHGLTFVPVSAGQDGSIWSVESVKTSTPLRAMNVPAVFAFSPESLMVPKELESEANGK